MPCPVPNPPVEPEEPKETVEGTIDLNTLDTEEKWLEQLDNIGRTALLSMHKALRKKRFI